MPKDTIHSDAESAAAYKAAANFTYLIAECGYREPKLIAQDRYACLMPLLFTHAIITGRIGDKVGYDDRWCYSSARSGECTRCVGRTG